MGFVFGKFWLAIVLVLVSMFGWSQNRLLEPSSSPVGGGGAFGNNAKALNLVNELRVKSRMSVESAVELDGSAYFDESFVLGDVFVGYAANSLKQMLRYNGFRDEIEVKIPGEKELSVLVKSSSISCKIGNSKYVYSDYLDKKGNGVSGYLILLVEYGEYKLWQKKAKVFKAGSQAKTSMHRDVPNRFLDDICFLAQKDKGVPKQIKPSNAFYYNFFTKEIAGKIKTFVKKNKLKLNNKEDLVNLFLYANAL